MNIEGRLVAGDLDLLRFLYPNYEVVNEIPTFPEKPAIYVGDLSIVDDFVKVYRDLNISFIVHTDFQSEINLDNRFILLSIVFKKYNRYIPKYVYEMMNVLDQNTFIWHCKYFWLTGEWLIKKLDYENTFLDFIRSLNSSKRELIQTYFNVIKDTGPYRIESSLLTFLIRARNKDYRGNSIVYNRMLNSFRGSKQSKIANGIKKSLNYKIDNRELRLLNMIICMVDQV